MQFLTFKTVLDLFIFEFEDLGQYIDLTPAKPHWPIPLWELATIAEIAYILLEDMWYAGVF